MSAQVVKLKSKNKESVHAERVSYYLELLTKDFTAKGIEYQKKLKAKKTA